MGTVYKKTFTKPLPAGSKIIVRKGRRLAEWKDTKGKTRTAPLTAAGDRITVEAGTYTAKYRDGSGVVREVATGCRDESAARSVLTKLERRAELVKGEVLSAVEDAAIDHQTTPLAGHIAAFIDHQQAKGLSRRVNDTRSQLHRVAADCGFRRLADLGATALERWLLDRKADGMSAATRNEYRGAWLTFCNWCMTTKPARLLSNPFARVPKADANADRRRTRRALTEAELTRLLAVARRRPLVDAMTIRRGKRKGELAAELRPDTRRRLERLGQERALIYKTLVLTGLRKGELASITVGQVVLDADLPYLVLEAADEKNRQGSTIPLRADLAADLREWLAERATARQDAARAVPIARFDADRLAARPTLPADTPLFTVPRDLVRILDRDLVAAGIARRVEVAPGKWKIDKQDERGRTVDVHALRHTFGTLLSKAGVAPRTAQAAMRHSTINLTMNTYTDPKLLDVAGAVESLPSLPLVGVADMEQTAEQSTLSATGTDDSTACSLAPMLAPTHGKSCKSLATVVKMTTEKAGEEDTDPIAASPCVVNKKDPLSISDNESCEWAMTDLNRRHPRCKRGALAN